MKPQTSLLAFLSASRLKRPHAGAIGQLGCVAALVLSSLAAPPASGAGEPRPQPNIILVVTDDQRWDSLGVMPSVTDRLVAEGASFTNAFVTTPLCTPSRASILTGRYSHQTGVYSNDARQFDPSSTLATWLHDAGYVTGLVGKYLNLYVLTGLGIPPGWDEWSAYIEGAYYDYELVENGVPTSYGSDPASYATDVLTEQSLAFIEENVDRPFFLVLAPYAPHEVALPAPRHEDALLEGFQLERPPSYLEQDISDKPNYVRWSRWLLGRDGPAALDQYVDSRDTVHRLQLETLLAVDEGIGEILDALDTHGIAEDTIIVFTSDNGMSWGEHWMNAKFHPYEESLRVPLVIRYPRVIPAGSQPSELALNIDIAPTLAALAGLEAVGPVDGQSLVELTTGATAGWRSDFLVEYLISASPNGVPQWAGIREARWKYLAYLTGFEELYDLESDPFELSNLLITQAEEPAHRERAAAMKARIPGIRGVPEPGAGPAGLAVLVGLRVARSRSHRRAPSAATARSDRLAPPARLGHNEEPRRPGRSALGGG